MSVVIDPKIRGKRRARILHDAVEGREWDPDQAFLVRVVEYDVPDRAGNGSGELIVLLSTILNPLRHARTSWPTPTTSGGNRKPVMIN